MNDRPSGASDYNTTIIEEFRANQGRVGGPWAGATLILIHHLGARSGTERVTPVGYFPQGEGRFAIVASNGGSPAHPDWYHNLKAHPKITAEVGTQTFTVLAQELDHAARAELWPKLVADTPCRRAIPGQDHATDSGGHTDPPGADLRQEPPICHAG